MGKSKGKRFGSGSRSSIKKCSSSTYPDCLSGGDPPKDRQNRIGSLPDDVLVLILSFLTCKERAKTSLLSRRWLYLWMHTQVLHFDYPVNCRLEAPSYRESQKFVNQVNHAFTLHRSQNLNEFRITCYLDKCFKKDISSWLGYALKRKIQNLELNFLVDGILAGNEEDAYDFSDRFLKLNSGNMSRSLKSLSLKGVKVTSEAIDFILRNSPCLERLEVVGSLELRNLVISNPKLVLKYLHIDQCAKLKHVSISDISLVTLKIKTMSLSLTNLPMLVDLLIRGAEENLRRVLSQSSCCHSQLGSLTIQTLNVQDITQLSELARLTKLKRLEIRFRCLDDECLVKLVSSLEACPCLGDFVLMLAWYVGVRTSRGVANAERRPLKCLKFFEFIGYSGRVGELELVRHILENSVALEKIVLDPFSPLKWSPLGLEQEEARSVARQQFEGLKESILPRVVIL